MKEGITYNSRKESDFIKRMEPKKRERYIKQWIARCNPNELLPFITILEHDKHYREIKYAIQIPNTESKGEN